MAHSAFGQVDTIIGQFTNTESESFAGAISANGRFVVFESRANLATVNPRNADGNNEIFLFDFAQRQIFQITDTKSVLFNPLSPATFNNVRIEITNRKPVISADGRWIAFASNATASTPGQPDGSNPGIFDGNIYTSPTPTPTPTPSPTPTPTPGPTPSPTPTPTPAFNPLQQDANLEMWLYEIPAYAPADLTSGAEIAFVNLAGGSFLQITNTPTSRLPIAGTNVSGPFVADDNHDPSISDDVGAVAFVSTRDLVPGGNPFPEADNDEIFVFARGPGIISQITETPRGPISDPIYNKNPSISGNGSRVAFASTGDNPIIGMTGGNNPASSRNEEVFFSDLDPNGAPTGIKRQVTVTTPATPGALVNLLDLGRRMSRDGRYIAFDSYADLANEHAGVNQESFALYLYDAVDNSFERVAPRSNADEEAQGGDVQRFPGFTDYVDGVATTLVFSSRMNFTSAGVIPTNEADGLNPSDFRPVQIYRHPINAVKGSSSFVRLTKFPLPNTFLASTQALTSDTSRRMAFNLALTEVGTGNFDLNSEVYYLYEPVIFNEQTEADVEFYTGASRLPINANVVATPSPTPTPSPSPTPTPTPTPTPSPSPGPTPPPVTPDSVLGMSPGMLVIMELPEGTATPAAPASAVGSLDRSFNLPMELSGVTLSINGAAALMKSVSSTEITFLVPRGLASSVNGTLYPYVLNNNGTVIRGELAIIPVRPDIFRTDMIPAPLGRARMLNVTNRVHTSEPFAVRTIQVRGGRFIQSRFRLYATGIATVPPQLLTIRLGDVSSFGGFILTGAVEVEPGIYTVDFQLVPLQTVTGDVPVVMSVGVGSTTFFSRLADTAPRTSFIDPFPEKPKEVMRKLR